MVLEGLKPSLEDASCCSVDVMKGGCGLRVTVFWDTDATCIAAC